MKKISLFALLSAALIMTGCGSSDTPTPEFAATDCNKYFEVLECLLDKQADAIPAEDRAIAQAAIDQQKDAWKDLPAEELSSVCAASMEGIRADADIYASFGCSVD